MDMKYDKMVAITQEESYRKIKTAMMAIKEMQEGMEQITVSALVKKTGLSRGFFYKNPIVRAELDQAKCRASSSDYKFKTESSKNNWEVGKTEAMETNLQDERLLEQVRILEQTNIELQKEVNRLQKQIKRKEISILKRL